MIAITKTLLPVLFSVLACHLPCLLMEFFLSLQLAMQQMSNSLTHLTRGWNMQWTDVLHECMGDDSSLMNPTTSGYFTPALPQDCDRYGSRSLCRVRLLHSQIAATWCHALRFIALIYAWKCTAHWVRFYYYSEYKMWHNSRVWTYAFDNSVSDIETSLVKNCKRIHLHSGAKTSPFLFLQ